MRDRNGRAFKNLSQYIRRAGPGPESAGRLDLRVIGENGSGKSTTEKLISGLLVTSAGEIRLYGKHYTDAGVHARKGVLIENPGCFPGSAVYQNLTKAPAPYPARA